MIWIAVVAIAAVFVGMELWYRHTELQDQAEIRRYPQDAEQAKERQS